ncbi:glycosyltransferase family 4 protein [uncultured Clostridium sp.]|uniref:glycosyltransferase family 4 protein n=1 Tax=uncultured Clostridium sp. TaxID=59620 RepID=UPI002594A176|nr:glycosyltransferase family 4 protein [uncultured Clostridium sp.]
MRRKALIYMHECQLKPVGGAAGYLFNLKTQLDIEGIDSVEFIQGESKESKVKKHLPKFIREILFIIKRYLDYTMLMSKIEKKAKVDLNEYDIIHFHNSFSMYKVKDSLKEYKGTVLLTSHSPKPMFLEIFEDVITPIERKLFKKKYMKLSQVDKYAFNRADNIVFPCVEAEEPYYRNWDEYNNIKESNKDKYKYILTGINSAYSKMNREEIREKYNIPKEAFVISYVGRHNKTKGYDVLKTIGKRLLEDENSYFLIGGKEEPITGIVNNRWIEVGWTNDPYSLIGASDVFILPNKETYFDIVMLEVLSLGKIIIASRTGGNKYFDTDDENGVLLYNSTEEALNLIKYIKKMDIGEKLRLENKNKELFNNEFTSEIFARNYIKLLDEIRNEKRR